MYIILHNTLDIILVIMVSRNVIKRSSRSPVFMFVMTCNSSCARVIDRTTKQLNRQPSNTFEWISPIIQWNVTIRTWRFYEYTVIIVSLNVQISNRRHHYRIVILLLPSNRYNKNMCAAEEAAWAWLQDVHCTPKTIMGWARFCTFLENCYC